VETLRFDKRMTEEMEWIYAEWGDSVYEPGFLKHKKADLDRWLDDQGIERKAKDKKKLLDLKFWSAKRELLEAARALAEEVGGEESRDFNVFEKRVKKANKALGLKLGAPQLKQILDAVSWTDPGAEPVKAKDGYEPDSDLRDTENVPLTWMEGEADARTVIQAYFDREVKPHVDDAWIAWDKTAVGYEICFNKYFYVHQPLRDLAEVVKEIRELEAETEGLLDKILDFGEGNRG
jgi:type I restriction enzyme M protein